MGLDEFMDIDAGTEDASKSNKSSNSDSKLLNHDNWVKDSDGNLKSRGPYGYEDMEEYEETVIGDLKRHGSLFKYHLPIFPHIEISDKYNRGDRYNCEKEFTTLTCVSHNKTELHRVNREVIMLDTGHTEKEECLNILSERFNEDIEPTTEVHMYFFAKMRHIVKMAMSDEFVDNWALKDKDRVMKAVYGEAWTQDFREKDTGEKDLKHIDEMGEW